MTVAVTSLQPRFEAWQLRNPEDRVDPSSSDEATQVLMPNKPITGCTRKKDRFFLRVEN